MQSTDIAPPGRGWLEFAGIFYVVAGVFNGIAGSAMLGKPSLFDDTKLIAARLSFWGTLLIVVATVQLIIAGLILFRFRLGRIAGILFGVFAMGLWFFTIFVAPFLAIVSIALYGVLIYGMTAHREEFGQSSGA